MKQVKKKIAKISTLYLYSTHLTFVECVIHLFYLHILSAHAIYHSKYMHLKMNSIFFFKRSVDLLRKMILQQ